MQTSAIRQRVADFLRRHAPFEYLTESDLLALASGGRVKFHESDEYVVWQGAAAGRFVFVIQQGSVSMWEQGEGSSEGERLRDIRGPGDLIGAEHLLGEASYELSARTNCDVVLYALPADKLRECLAGAPRAMAFLAAQRRVEAMEEVGVDRLTCQIPLTEAATSLPTLEANAKLAEVAQAILSNGADAVAIESRVISSRRLLAALANGTVDIAASSFAEPVPSLDATQKVADAALKLSESGEAAVVVAGESTERFITRRALTPFFRDHPVDIIEETRSSSRIATLAQLHRRARAFIQTELRVPCAAEWLAAWSSVFDRAILGRLLALSEPEAHGWCWCFSGAPGRSENLSAAMPPVCVIVAEDMDLEAASTALERILRGLAEVDYFPAPGTSFSGVPVATVAQWRAQFDRWITDPVRSGAARSLDAFDLRPVAGRVALFDDVASGVRALAKTESTFTALLAHDCLANLPPLTFFRELVVAESGEQSATFQIERSALRPIVDVARAFSIASGAVLGESTRDRLRKASAFLPQHASVFTEAAATLDVVLYHQARSALRTRTDGREIAAATIGAQDRQVLRRGFRAILRLLELAESFSWMDVSVEQA